jgi:hypothetical protein
MLEAGSGTKFQLLSLFNIVGPFLGLIRNLGVRQLLYKKTILENAFVLEDAILEKVTLILKTLLDSIRVY